MPGWLCAPLTAPAAAALLRRSSTMRPSARCSCRSQRSARLGIVGDQQQAGAVARVLGEQAIDDEPAGRAVEIAGRLVGQQQRGPATKARAIATRCCSPPDSCAGIVRRARWPSPTRPSAASAAAKASRAPAELQRDRDVFAARSSSAAGETPGRRCRCGCGAAARARPRRAPPRSCPATSTRPALGRSSPAVTIISVDLPEPDGPTSATVSPAAIGQRHAAQNLDRPRRAGQAEVDIVEHDQGSGDMGYRGIWRSAGHFRSAPGRRASGPRASRPQFTQPAGGRDARGPFPCSFIDLIRSTHQCYRTMNRIGPLVLASPAAGGRPRHGADAADRRFRRQPDRRARAAGERGVSGAARGAAARRGARRPHRQCRGVGRHHDRRPRAARLGARRQARSRHPRARRQRRAARHRPRDRARQSRRDDRQDPGERRQAAAARHAGAAELGRGLRSRRSTASTPSLRRRMACRSIRFSSKVWR